MVYILELSTVLALRNEETVELLGEGVAKALQSILRDASRYHTSLVSRAAFYQFHILRASYVSWLERALKHYEPWLICYRTTTSFAPQCYCTPSLVSPRRL